MLSYGSSFDISSLPAPDRKTLQAQFFFMALDARMVHKVHKNGISCVQLRNTITGQTQVN